MKKIIGVSFFVGILFNTVSVEARAAGNETQKKPELEELQTVEVKASPKVDTNALPKPYAGGQVARGGRLGLLGNKDIMDTPFSITSYTAQTIQDQQARTIADVVLNDASVRNINPSAGRFDQFSIRGFTVLNSEVAFGGLYGIVPTYSVPVEATERVEIVKGPNALLNGMAPSGGVGGTINVVPKRAGDKPLTQITGSYISDSQFGGHVDIGRRFGPDNSVGVRFNSVYQDGDTPLKHQGLKRSVNTLALDFRGESLRLFTDLVHQERNVNAPMERVAVSTGLQAPSASRVGNNFAPSWTYANSRDTYGVFRAEYDFSPNLSAYAAIGARSGRYDFLRSNVTMNNANGNYLIQPFHFLYKENALSAETGLHGKLETGWVKHAINLSMSDFRLEFGSARQNFASFNAQSNIFNPIERAEPLLGGLSEDLPILSKTRLSGIALSDTLSVMEDKVQLTLGGRLQRVQVRAYNATGAQQTSSYDEQALTPAVGILVKPWQRISLYANYIEALTQGPSPTTGANNINDIFAPIKTKQVETGIKVDFGKMMATASLFSINQPSGFINPATSIFAVDGEQQNQGAELNVFGEPYSGVRVQGGVMLLDGKLKKTRAGINDGNTAAGTPKVNANIGGEWDIPNAPGLTFTARSIYTSSQYLDAENTQEIPDWVRLDFGARYKLQTTKIPVTVRASLLNAFDKRYWSSAAMSGLTLGDARTVMLSTTVDF